MAFEPKFSAGCLVADLTGDINKIVAVEPWASGLNGHLWKYYLETSDGHLWDSVNEDAFTVMYEL